MNHPLLTSWLRPALTTTAILLTMACGDGGCGGCGGFEARPFPAQHYDKTQPNSAQIRLTPTGLDFLEQNLEPILAEALPGGLQFCLPKDTQSSTKLCFPYDNGMQPMCDDGREGCQINMSIDSAELNPVPDDKLLVKIALGNVNPKISFETNVAVIGTVRCDITIHKLRQSRTTPATIRGELPVQFTVDNNSPTKDTRVELLEATIDMSDADFYIEGNGSGGWKCGTANALKGLFRGTIENLVKERLRSAIEDITREQLCLTCADGPGVCPSAATCRDIEGLNVCMYNNQDKCVPRPLGMEGRAQLGQLIGNYTQNPTAAMDVLFKLADYAKADTGLTLTMRSGFQPDQIARCAPIDPTQRPPFAAIPVSPTLVADRHPNGGQPYMFGFGLHQRVLEQALWSVWGSGATCLGIDSSVSDLLSTSTFAIVLRSLRSLADNERRALALQITPQKAPKVKLGANTVRQDNGKTVIDEALMTIDWKDMDLHIYGWVHDRYTRILTMRVDLLLPLAVVPDGTGKLAVVIGDLKAALVNPRPSNAGLLTEDPRRLAELLPTLIGLATPALAGALDLSFDVPELFGFKLAITQRDITSIDNNTMIGIFASLERAMPMVMSQTGAMLTTTIVHVGTDYQPLPSGLAQPTVRLKLDTTPLLAGQQLPDTIAYSWRVDGGFWHQYEVGQTLAIDDPVLVLPGKHTIEVRARGAYGDRLVGGDATKIEVYTDPTIPTLALQQQGRTVVMLGADDVDQQSELRYRWRLELTDGQPGEWTAWSSTAIADLREQWLPPVFRFEAQVMDRAGNIASARALMSHDVTLPQPAAPASQDEASPTFGCAAAPGQRAPSGAAGALLALLGMIGVARRRKTRALLAALISLVGLGGAGCSDDGANQNKTKVCEPACGQNQKCEDGVCVDLPAMCMGDNDCSVGERCLGNRCAKTACEADDACAAVCPDGFRGTCASGACACEKLCAAGCGEGQFCCESSNSCKATPGACDGKSCGKGFEPEVVSAGTVNPSSCALEGAQCDCKPLAPLAIGVYGRWLDVAQGGGVTAVSGYNQTYGDLMVGVIEGQQLVLSFVDGVPADGNITGALDGPRGGISTAGPNVGAHTALAIGDDGALHILYRDQDNKALKYAKGTKKGSAYDFALATLDTDGEPALWTDAVLKDGVLHVVYMAPQVQTMGGGWEGQLRYLALDPSKAPSEQAVRPRVLLTGSAAKPCGADCTGDDVCFPSVSACRAVDASCATACAEGFGCLEGQCQPTFNTAAPLALAPTAAQFMELSATPTGLLLVFYDHTRGEVGWMRYEQGDWERMPEYLGKPSGPYASGLVDSNGIFHLAYMVEASGGALVYEQIGQGVRETILDGLRDTASEWLMARVGEDVHLRLDGMGRPAVLFHDATLHQLRAATRTAAGRWMPQTLAEPGATYSGARGFYAGAVRTSGPSVALEYVIQNQASPVEGFLVAHPLP
jgi:hypothetical protein